VVTGMAHRKKTVPHCPLLEPRRPGSYPPSYLRRLISSALPAAPASAAMSASAAGIPPPPPQVSTDDSPKFLIKHLFFQCGTIMSVSSWDHQSNSVLNSVTLYSHHY
jgi:hypothetical protein